MNDQQFIQQFESAHLPDFAHRDHIRMAWLYLRDHPVDIATQKICDGLRHFAQAHGAVNKYHATITLFWVKVVIHARNESPEINDFDDFIDTHPYLLDKSIMTRHYSPALLGSIDARQTFIEPDLLPMPEIV